jgi:type I pantothenate kinase
MTFDRSDLERPGHGRAVLLASLAESIVSGTTDALATVVMLTGPVCSGKTTLAATICDQLVGKGLRAEAVSTDGFLRSTADLTADGLFERKGFPESYNVTALQAAIEKMRSRESTTVPIYSHATFDPDDVRIVPPLDVVIIEGVNALQPNVSGRANLCWYLDAPDEVVARWYIERFRWLTAAAATGGGFYAQFLSMSEEQLGTFARQVWTSINQPNLDECIRPTKAFADVVIDAQMLRF